jgi:hypothetical protein
LPPNIDAIVAAVKDPPRNLKKKHKKILLADLDAAVLVYQHGRRLRRLTARYKEKNKTIELAQKLVSRLENDFWYGSEALVATREALKHIQARKESAKLWRVLGVEKGSAFDNLVGRGLASIFKNHFELPATYTKDNYDDDNPIKGPFIDFAEIALAEFGMPHSRRAIAEALTRGRRGRKKVPAKPEKK